MDKSGTKILKILIFIGVFVFQQYYDIKRGDFTIDSLTDGLMLALLAYLVTSLFGIVSSISKNFFVAIVGTGALAVFLGYKLDEVTASVSWLTEGQVDVALVALTTLCIIGDIRAVKRTLMPSKVAIGESITGSTEKKAGNSTMRNCLKENPQTVLNLSNMLEEEWGRKPSYDEVISYIDNMVLPEDGLEDTLNS